MIAAFGRPNPTLWIVLAAAAMFFAITFRWPPARQLFDFGEFHGHDILISMRLGLGLLAVLEGLKFIYLSASN